MRFRDCRDQISNCVKKGLHIKHLFWLLSVSVLMEHWCEEAILLFPPFLTSLHYVITVQRRWNVSGWSSGFWNSKSVSSTTFHQAWTLQDLWHSEYFGTSFRLKPTEPSCVCTNKRGTHPSYATVLNPQDIAMLLSLTECWYLLFL